MQCDDKKYIQEDANLKQKKASMDTSAVMTIAKEDRDQAVSDKVTNLAGIIEVKGTIDNKQQKPKPKHKFFDTLQ